MSSPVADDENKEPSAGPKRTWVPLTPAERRVVGVLAEKAKTTPEYYPLSLNALVSGCNQKSNRDPITNYDADDVEEILRTLQTKGAAVRVEGTGRVVRWKHTLYDWLDLRNQPVAMAVLVELLLRGPQTEGDLRGRASRMEEIPDLPALQAVLEKLVERGLAVRLSPQGQVRGVMVTHGLYPPEELERARQAYAASGAAAAADAAEPRPARAEASAAAWAAEAAALREEIATLRESVQTLEAELRALKSALGV